MGIMTTRRRAALQTNAGWLKAQKSNARLVATGWLGWTKLERQMGLFGNITLLAPAPPAGIDEPMPRPITGESSAFDMSDLGQYGWLFAICQEPGHSMHLMRSEEIPQPVRGECYVLGEGNLTFDTGYDGEKQVGIAPHDGNFPFLNEENLWVLHASLVDVYFFVERRVYFAGIASAAKQTAELVS